MITAGLLLREIVPPLDARLTMLSAPPRGIAERLALAGSGVPMLLVLAGLMIVFVQAWRTDRTALLRSVPRYLAVLAACPLLLLLQGMIGRQGPPRQPNPTYPSGHAVVIGALVAITVLIVIKFPSVIGRIVLVVDSVAVVVVAGSRIVLAEHYLIDLVGGLVGVTGIALLLGGILGLLPTRRKTAPAPR